ncbi:MAG: hypothetical protein JKY65_02805 [Planctomycetes bacterium]|nr:hypothetical protein [Planctomycetota bacterium]
MKITTLAISVTLAALTLTGCPAPAKTGKTTKTGSAASSPAAKSGSAAATPAKTK